MSISDQLRNAIEQSGETYYAIAKGAGVSYAVLHRFAAGTRPTIQLDSADRLCDYLGLELREKRGGKTSGKEK